MRAREKVYITGLDVSEKGLTLILLHSDFCIVMCVVNMLINLLLIQSTVLISADDRNDPRHITTETVMLHTCFRNVHVGKENSKT